jgi:hypothetical protein
VAATTGKKNSDPDVIDGGIEHSVPPFCFGACAKDQPGEPVAAVYGGGFY